MEKKTPGLNKASVKTNLRFCRWWGFPSDGKSRTLQLTNILARRVCWARWAPSIITIFESTMCKKIVTLLRHCIHAIVTASWASTNPLLQRALDWLRPAPTALSVVGLVGRWCNVGDLLTHGRFKNCNYRWCPSGPANPARIFVKRKGGVFPSPGNPHHRQNPTFTLD